MKKVIRLNERELKNMVMESVRRIMMNENFEDVASTGFDPEAGEDEYSEMESLRGNGMEDSGIDQQQVNQLVNKLNAAIQQEKQAQGVEGEGEWFNQ